MPSTPRGKRTTGPDGVRVTGKAANGEGSVYFDRSNSLWIATYLLPGEVNAAGRPKIRKVTGPTRAVVLNRRAARLAHAAFQSDSAAVGGLISVHEYCEWWLDIVQAPRVRPSSLQAIRARLTAARLGELAPMRLLDVRPHDVAHWQQRLLTSLAPKTVADSRTALAQVFDAAVDHDALPANPVRRVKAPRVERHVGRALSIDEVRSLVAATNGYRYGPVLAILYGQGWRVSEALGLAWDDIDLETGVAHVRRAVIEVSGHGRRLAPPKTAGAEGKHILLPGVINRLERWRSVQADERAAAGALWQTHRYEGRVVALVFTNTLGGLVPRQAIDKLGRRIAESIGIDPTGLGTHAGRRSVITALYSAGETLDDVARHVGHRSTATTAGYVAALGDRPKRTAEVAAALLDDGLAGTMTALDLPL